MKWWLGLMLSSTALAGPQASDFTLRDLRGERVSLSDHAGSVILVDFWATWCGPCKDELPHVQKMYSDLADQGFVVLAVTTDDARTKGQVKPFIRRSGYDFPVLYDTDNSALLAYNPSKTLPFSVVIDRDFSVHSVHSGYNPGDEVELRAEIVGLLEAPSTAEPAEDPASPEPAPSEPASEAPEAPALADPPPPAE